MSAIEFNSDELYNPGEEIIDPYVFLHSLEKECHLAHPTQPDKEKVSHHFFASNSLIYTYCDEEIRNTFLRKSKFISY